MVRSQTPAISAAAIQLILLAIAFKITSCSFIIRSSSAAETFSGVVKLQHPAAFQNRTTHVLIGPDNSHASDRSSDTACRRLTKLVYRGMLTRIPLVVLLAGACLGQNAARMDQVVQSYVAKRQFMGSARRSTIF